MEIVEVDLSYLSLYIYLSMKWINRNFSIINLEIVLKSDHLRNSNRTTNLLTHRFSFNSLELQLWAWNILYSSVICYAPGVSTRTFRPHVMEKNFKEF